MLVAGLVLAGCGGSGHGAGEGTTTSTRTVTQTAGVTVAASPKPSAIDYCSPQDLGIHYVGGDGAAGTWISTFAFVNVTHHDCRLDGYPGVAMLTATGRRIPIPVYRERAYRPHPVLVKPRGHVNFALGTGDGAVGPCYRAAIFRFIPPNDRGYEQIAHRRVVCGKAAFVSAVGDRY